MFSEIGRKHDWVFYHPRFPERRAKGFRKVFTRAKEEAGWGERHTSYCLRHFFITTAIESDVNFLVIARWVGHSTTRMIEQVYAQLRDGFKEAEMSKIKLNLTNGGKANGDKKIDFQKGEGYVPAFDAETKPSRERHGTFHRLSAGVGGRS